MKNLVTGLFGLSLLSLAFMILVLSLGTVLVRPATAAPTLGDIPGGSYLSEIKRRSSAALRRMPSAAQIRSIQDARLRSAALQVRQAMEQLSRADSRNAGRLQANYDRAVDRLARLVKAQGTGGSGPQQAKTCAFKCNDDRLECKKKCKAKGKKLCGCGFTFGACLVSSVFRGCD